MHTVEEATYMLNRMDGSNLLSVDTESTGLNCKGGEHYLTGIAIADEHLQSYYFPFQHPTLGPGDSNLPMSFFPEVVRFLNQSRKTHIWWNLKHDYQAMHTVDVDMRDWVSTPVDGMIEVYLLNEELPSYELDAISWRILKERKEDKVPAYAKAFGWDAVTPGMMDSYARQDVALPMRIHWQADAELKSRSDDMYDLQELARFKSRFAMHLGELEREGVGVVESFCQEMYDRGRMVMQMIQQKLGFNPGSKNELEDYLLNFLRLPVLLRSEKTGRPSFDKTVMAKYEELLETVQDESARLVLDYRGWGKATSSLYLPMLEKRDSDGKVRTEFRQARTSTGRLASANPNLQQIPRSTPKEWNGRAKESFWSGDPDFALVGFDYAQLELRLGTAYGRDQKLLDAFANGEDVFNLFAKDIMGELNDETRYLIKNRFIYPINYGAGKRKIASGLGVSMEKVNGFYEAYHREYPGLFTASKECERKALNKGYIRYWTGRRRHCRYPDKAYKYWNSLLQGGAAELVERSMMKLPNEPDCKQVLQVHDEVVFAIRRDKIPAYSKHIIDVMTDWPQFGVTFKVQGKEWTGAEMAAAA